MALINRLSPTRTTPVQKTGSDKLFGTGVDGTVVISTNTFLSRDMYYDTLTVNSSVTLFTNGFRVFVKNTLTNNGTVGMPAGVSQTTAVLAGTVLTRIDSGGGFTTGSSIDSANSSGTLPVGNVKDYDALLTGIQQGGGTLGRWYVGTQGTNGSKGADGTDGTANAGGAGSGGGSTAGNPGTAGTKGTGGAGGSAGLGGGVVVVVAKTITGTGTFVSAPTTGATGAAGNAGNPGVAGNPGTTVPGTVGHNPTGHAVGHNPTGHAVGHNAAAHNPEVSYHCCSSHNAKYGAHNPGWHHVNAYAHHTPATAYHYSHPGTSFHYSHPGTQFHNPTYPGGAGGTANPGNAGATGATGTDGKQGGLVVLTRSISTHIASSNTTFVQDIDG